MLTKGCRLTVISQPGNARQMMSPIAARWWPTLCAVLALVAVVVRPAAATIFLDGDFIQLPINSTFLPGQFIADDTSSGAKYNVNGTGGAAGQDFWIFGTPVYNYTVAIGGSTFRTNGSGWAVAPTVNDTSSGSNNSATISGQPITGLTFTRQINFADASEAIAITDTVTNNSGAALTQVATLDNTDPDQDQPFTFDTENDVVSAQVSNDAVVATAPNTGLSLVFASPSPLRVVDASGFDNTNPYTIIAMPFDPNGSAGDIGINIAINYGTLADSASQTVTWYMVFGADKAAALDNYAVVTGCGDGVLGVGEECDDGGTAPGDGCNAACRVEPCYTCSGAPSTCSALPDGSTCNDGLFCNGTDSCASASCSVHFGDPCLGGGDCTDDCNETNDSCIVPGSACTDDGNQCTSDECDSGGTCVHANTFFDPCDDGVFCNGADSCFDGSCQFHDGDPCLFDPCKSGCNEIAGMCDPTVAGTSCASDFDVCTSDQCDGAGNCAHPPGPDGVACAEDGNDCTGDECISGVCAHPTLPSGRPCAADSSSCTDDQCDGARACVHLPRGDGASCDDGNACTQTDECEAGVCVGSEPVVCPGELCKVQPTCDTQTGVCTSCPAGYTSANGGCQKRYAIRANTLDGLSFSCDLFGVNRYNGCSSSAFGFHWTDTGSSAVGTVVRVDVALNAGFDCGDAHTVRLNSAPIGVYASTTGTSCQCDATLVARTFSSMLPASYVKGGSNAIAITPNGCAGLNVDAGGNFATVAVTYADLGAPLAIRDGCRQAAKSRFQYRNNDNDARDKMGWNWGKGEATTQPELSDPTTSADYELCVFMVSSAAPALLLGADVPADGTRWRAAGSTGFRYDDNAAAAAGMQRLLLRGGADGKSKLVVKGAGSALADPALPLPLTLNGIRVQLTNQSNGKCWESEFPLNTITADERRIRAKTQ